MSERFRPGLFVPPWIRREHVARYDFAAHYVAGKRVVDCACGEGMGMVWCVRAGAACVAGIDRALDAALACRKRCAGANCFIAVAQATALPLPSGWAEVYIALETIEHLQDARAFLDEVLRVLSADGTFICSTPNRTVTNPGTAITQQPRNPFHVREYTAEELLRLLDEVFGQVALYGQRPIHRMAPRAYHTSKLLRFIWDRPASYAVRPFDADARPEYLVAVCRRPRARRNEVSQ